MCLSQILACIRFRGAPNDGSGALSVVLTCALSVSVLFGRTPRAGIVSLYTV